MNKNKIYNFVVDGKMKQLEFIGSIKNEIFDLEYAYFRDLKECENIYALRVETGENNTDIMYPIDTEEERNLALKFYEEMESKTHGK